MRSWRLSTRILLGAAALWAAGLALFLAAPSIVPEGSGAGLLLVTFVFGGAVVMIVLVIAWLIIRAINNWIGETPDRR